MCVDALTDISIILTSINNSRVLTLTIGLDSTRPEEVITGPLAVSNQSLVLIFIFPYAQARWNRFLSKC